MTDRNPHGDFVKPERAALYGPRPSSPHQSSSATRLLVVRWEEHREDCDYERAIRRRKCVICAQEVKYKDPPFPVCECGTRVYCGEECQAQDWAAGHKLRCASRLRYRPVTPDASADPLDALAADALAADALAAAVLDDDLDDVDDI